MKNSMEKGQWAGSEETTPLLTSQPTRQTCSPYRAGIACLCSICIVVTLLVLGLPYFEATPVAWGPGLTKATMGKRAEFYFQWRNGYNHNRTIFPASWFSLSFRDLKGQELDYKYAIIEGKGYYTMRYLPTQALKMKLSVITRAPRGGPTVQAGPFLVTVVDPANRPR